MPDKAMFASHFATTCANLPLAPDDGRGASTLLVVTHGPQVRFGYRCEDTLWFARLASRSCFTAAQDLDGRAVEYGVVEPDVRLGNPHPYGFDRGMFVERTSGDPLCQGLDQLHGRPLDDVARHAVDLAIVHGLRQVIGDPRWPQVEVQLDAHDERLAKLMLDLQGPVATVEDHVSKEYAILAHRLYSHPSIRISMPRMRSLRGARCSKISGYSTTT